MYKKSNRPDFHHFTGRKRGKKTRRKSRERRFPEGHEHINEYAGLAPKKEYSLEDKTLRTLPLRGEPGEVIPRGVIYLWHDRRYRLLEAVVIPPSGNTFGNFKLVKN